MSLAQVGPLDSARGRIVVLHLRRDACGGTEGSDGDVHLAAGAHHPGDCLAGRYVLLVFIRIAGDAYDAGQQDVCQTDVDGRAFHNGLVDVLRLGSASQTDAGRDLIQPPGGRRVARRLADGLQFDPAQLCHAGYQHAQRIRCAGLECIGRVDVRTDILIGILSQYAVDVVVADCHADSAVRAAGSGGFVAAGLQRHVQQANGTVERIALRDPIGHCRRLDAVVLEHRAVRANVRHVDAVQRHFQAAGGHDAHAGDLRYVAQVVRELEEVVFADGRNASVCQVDIGAAQFHAGGVIRAEVHRYGKILGLLGQELPVEAVRHLQEHSLGVPVVGIVHHRHGGADVRVDGTAQIVGLQQYAAAHPLQDAVVDRHRHDAARVRLYIHAVERIHVLGVQAERIEYGLSVRILRQLHVAGGSLHLGQRNAVRVADCGHQIVILGLRSQVRSGRIQEQVERIVSGLRRSADRGGPGVVVLDIQRHQFELYVEVLDAGILQFSVDIKVLRQVLFPRPFRYELRLFSREAVRIFAVGVDVADAAAAHEPDLDGRDVPVRHDVALNDERHIHEFVDVLYIHEEVVCPARTELVRKVAHRVVHVRGFPFELAGADFGSGPADIVVHSRDDVESGDGLQLVVRIEEVAVCGNAACQLAVLRQDGATVRIDAFRLAVGSRGDAHHELRGIAVLRNEVTGADLRGAVSGSALDASEFAGIVVFDADPAQGTVFAGASGSPGRADVAVRLLDDFDVIQF